MDIVVFIKQVPDTESSIRIAEGERSVVEEGLNYVVNPYDEYAVEEALLIRKRAARGR